MFCNETSGSDIVKSQAHHLPELLKRLQPKHSSFFSLWASKTELSYYWLSDESLIGILCACGESISHTQITAFGDRVML